MKLLIRDTKLDFSDVLLQPIPSSIQSRESVNVTRTFSFQNSNQTWTGVPVIASNMDTVGTLEMYRELSKHRMITCFHKHYSVNEYPTDLDRNYYMVSTGIHDHDFRKLQKIIKKVNPLFVCIDVANGYISNVPEFVSKVRTEYPTIVIMVGNVVTGVICSHLLSCGADIVKVGIGSGSVCETRLVTGIGYPQLSAISETSLYIRNSDEEKGGSCDHDTPSTGGTYICGDGGVQCVGDLVKGFAAGAGFMMVGSLLAGHTESAGELQEDQDGKVYKLFYGMSSKKAMEKYNGSMASYRSSEGKVVKVPYKGPVKDTIMHILGGIRSAMTYLNAGRLEDIYENAIFIRVNHQHNKIYNKNT